MTLGILGGCGPLVGAHFLSLLYEMTDARADADYPDVLLSSLATTPDRTAHLLDPRAPDPTPALLSAATSLLSGGADLLLLLCHTAHAFLPALRARIRVPILDLPSIGILSAARMGVSRLGVLSSLGSRHARLFETAAAPLGIEILHPPAPLCGEVQSCIYDRLKTGTAPEGGALLAATAALADRGAQAVLLGCTELSLPAARPETPLPIPCIDPLTPLARHAISLCGKKIKEAYRYDAAWRPALDTLPPTLANTAPVG